MQEVSEQVAVHPVSRTRGAAWMTRGFQASTRTKVKVKVRVNMTRRQEKGVAKGVGVA